LRNRLRKNQRILVRKGLRMLERKGRRMLERKGEKVRVFEKDKKFLYRMN
jgi:hypothetical protein